MKWGWHCAFNVWWKSAPKATQSGYINSWFSASLFDGWSWTNPIGVFIYGLDLLRDSILCLNIVFKVVDSLKVGGMHHMKRNQPMMFAQMMTMSKKECIFCVPKEHEELFPWKESRTMCVCLLEWPWINNERKMLKGNKPCHFILVGICLYRLQHF